jgi:hypothetical protein
MPPKDEKKISVLRLRIGILFFILWWIPIYLTLPYLDRKLDATSNRSKAVVAVCIITAQTILGIIGLILVGKLFALILKDIKPRKLPAAMWHILISGETDINPNYLRSKKTKKIPKN